ncbi:hypothetical protein VMCG_06612 [Cytospora schulzeri]|uniref:UBZ4-type domain-containing protein n=1 Tax=Cytospora schulzeri TaxID=448051 RepID=A0A423W6R4_9PEZI|nr:hypothetical protein VMCG_06612 [Valsa malicola]
MSTRRHPPVPTTSQVIPGATVNIVLKADQPTGRTVQGVVRDLLTRGNHPRGIKVRLADGRVGRVQSMASGSSTATSSSSASAPVNPGGMSSSVGGGVMLDTSIGEGSAAVGQAQSFDDHGYGSAGRQSRRGGRRGGRGGNGSRGFDDEPELPSQQIGLDAYHEEPAAAGSQAPAEIVTCPVCGAFEGDETAVAHHVAAHFDTGS